jgi:PAS domain-containing protein
VGGEQFGESGMPEGEPERRRLRDIVAQVQDYAIIGLDPQGVIESWNLGAERVKGYTAEEAIGRSFAMFYTPVGACARTAPDSGATS